MTIEHPRDLAPDEIHLRQKPSLGLTRLRRSWQWRRALAAFQANRRMRYAMTSAALRLTPAPQCTSTAASRHQNGVARDPRHRHACSSGPTRRLCCVAQSSASRDSGNAHVCCSGGVRHAGKEEQEGVCLYGRTTRRVHMHFHNKKSWWHTVPSCSGLLDEVVAGREEGRYVLRVHVGQGELQTRVLGRQLQVLRIVMDADHPARTATHPCQIAGRMMCSHVWQLGSGTDRTL